MSQYFKEYGRALEMLRKIDSYTGEKIQNFRKDVYDLVKYIPIYEQIEKASPDVKAYEINPEHCDSRSNKNIKANTIEEMCDEIKQLCNNKDKNFILAYNDNPDGLLHKYGTTSDEVKEFILNAEENIEKLCNDLKKTNTLVIISADHGHIDIKKTYNVLDMEEIQDCIIMPPSLESRAITFWVKEDKKEKFEMIFEENFKDEFILYTKEEFLNKKFLGEGTKHRKIDDFIGNYIAMAISDSIIKIETDISKEKKNKKSTHCGLTEDEMIVPLILI